MFDKSSSFRSMNSKRAILVALLCCASLVQSGPSRISVEPDGGYSGIVFKISDDVSEDSCADILKNLQVLLTDASRVLHRALDGRVFFKDVTVVVPNSWRDEKCQTQILVPRGSTTYGTPDIHIDMDHPFHRGSPYTQQSKGCGQSGDFMALPANFLATWNSTVATWGNPAKVFVHEWAKLRYGIFDEFGFSGDPLYPNFFKIRNEIVPTGTSNVPIEGTWVKRSNTSDECDPELQGSDDGEECFFMPQINQSATCSLGYMPFLSNVEKFCATNDIWHRKDALAPTKHNVLCQGKSSQEVILSHEDFVGRDARLREEVTELLRDSENSESSTDFPFSTGDDLERSVTPQVAMKIVREPTPKYVLIIESSSSMIDQNLWKWVHKAAQKFIRYDLADSSRLAIVTFSNESRVQHSLASLSDERTRARLADTIPDKYKVQRSPSQRCVICGVQTAMQKVLAGEEAGAHLILVTRGDNNTLSLTDENLILEHTRQYQIKFSAILLPQGEQSALSFYDSVSQLSGGRTVVLATPPVGDGTLISTALYSRMMDAFHDIRRLDSAFPADIPITVHTQTTTRTDGALGTTGSFVIDTSLGRETQFSVVVEESDDYFIKSVSFSDSTGQTYGPYSSLTNDFNVINVKTINFPQDTLSPPFDDPAHLGMTWQYVVQWYNGGNMEQENVIRVESKPRNLGSFGLIDIRVWTNSDSTSDLVTNLNPLQIFVSVSRGTSPIIMARVRVSVNVSLANGTIIPIEALDLFDKGNGDPDLTSGDGIYSRYLTTYPAVGRYSFSVEVDDNDGSAFTVQEGRGGRAMPAVPPSPGPPVCCGSQITVPRDLRFPTGTFRRSVDTGPVVHLLNVPESDGADRMPPSRISDLRLTPDSEGQKLSAKWTAPGDDYDHGSVTGYNFIFSEDVNDLLDPSRQPPILHSVSQSDPAGSESSYSFSFKRYDKDYHVGIYAIDETGNRANISNIVLVRISEPETTENPTGGTESPVSPEDTDWVMIGVVTGVVVILIIFLLVGLYIYFFLVRRRRNNRQHPSAKSSGVNVDMHHNRGPGSGAGSDNATDNGSYDDTKNSSSNHLVPKISTISNAYRVAAANGTTNGSTGSFANGITPTYWSASQLLKEHEERKLRETLSKKTGSKMTMSGDELSMGNNNNESLGMGEEANVAYEYAHEPPFHQYGYYNDSPMIDTYPQQLDPYFGYNPHRLSTADSTGYPVTYGYQMHPGGPDIYSQHAAMMEQFNATLEGSSDGESALNRNGVLTHHPRGSHVAGNGTSIPKHSGSDQSSSGTLGVANQSLQGSLLSVNSGRPPSSTSKTRNITQV